MSDEKLWEAVNDLREDRATILQALKDQTRSMDDLNQTIKEDIQRGHEIHGAHSVQIAGLAKDIDSVGIKVRTVADDLKEHKDNHWKWISIALAAPASIVAFFALIKLLAH